MEDSMNAHDEFGTVDDLTNKNFVDCYQMQVDEENNCTPIHLGKYPDVALPVHKIINYKKYLLHVVTYLLTQEEVDNKLYKIVGVNVFRRNRKSSICSLDLVKNGDESGYQLLFCDHRKNTVDVVENIEKFPGKDKVLGYVIQKAFEDPVKSILLQ